MALLRTTAYEKVRNIYNWKVIAKRTLELYDKVLREATQLGPDGISSTPLSPLLKAAPTVPLTPATERS